jgi:hypothetical protein
VIKLSTQDTKEWRRRWNGGRARIL